MKFAHSCFSRGIALITVLSFVAILSLLLVSFMTVMRLERSASRNYSQSIRAEQLAQGALALITEDLRQEIIAASNEIITGGVTLYTPRTVKSILPARYGDAAATPEPNLVRRSLSNQALVNAAYPSTDYDTTLVPAVQDGVLASPVPTDENSANRRKISPARWNKPRLLRDPGDFSVPDWIYVTRDGPKAFTTYSPSLASTASDDYIIGRYAYVIYDQSGLLDINLAGSPSIADARDRNGKAFTGFADLTALPGISPGNADDLVNWRNPWSKANYASLFLTDGARGGFRKVLGSGTASDNTFLGRQDLIDYTERLGSPLPSSALRFLTTFSRELNSPSAPAGPDTTLNPDFSTLVREGKPIRRFPLSHFARLATDPSALSATDAEEIERLFGLTPISGTSASYRAWQYRSATIGTPQAAIAAGRDPDLFELVKAAITNGSLGAKAGNTTNSLVREIGGSDYSPEANVHHQIARIIANIADQFDSDNYPTTIRMGSTDVYGIESLPYFSEIFFKARFPTGFSSGTGTLYCYFELWNPHQGSIPATGPGRVRIRMNSDARIMISYVQIPFLGYATTITGVTADPPGNPFPPNDIILGNLSNYQGNPKVAVDSAHSPSYITDLSAPFNGWRAVLVNRPIPTTFTGSLKFTALHTSRMVPVLEFESAPNTWHPYTTFAGHFTSLGTTGVQGGSNPFMNNNLGGGPSANNNINSINLSYPKPDPRTFRYRSGVSFGGSFENSMLPTSVGNGQALDQNKSDGAPSNPALLYRNQTTQTVADVDGMVRPADGYLDASPLAYTANPMSSTSTLARPIILNRPFRSLAELGYVFRDAPWKSLDFFSDQSPDSALLDLFCLEDSEVVAGKVNLNTRNSEVLQALLRGSLRDEVAASATITTSEAITIADTLITASTASSGPLRNRADIARTLAPTPVESTIKNHREAAVRALAPNTQTRTWNLLVDVIAETGRFTPSATTLAGFTTDGARRYWLHLAIDRFTGKVIDSQLEPVYE